ncbi:hypothetical protein VTL71DRAFT_8573 [Oculimacula yallundae]|uniref:SAP domain-containing protein n=1 Tax=Oculimacula yallundae TaxID=86028 RepID=A0ABR4D0D7_9HELO
MAATASMPVSPAVTFHGFPQLALELRTMIWKFAARQVRVVEVEEIQAKYKGRIHVRRYGSKTLVPGMLHACDESREIGLRGYEKIVFDGIFTGSYINWDIDYIGYRPAFIWNTTYELDRFLSSQQPRTSPAKMAKKCRRMVIFDCYLAIWNSHRMRKLKNLEEVVFLFPDDFGESCRGSGNVNLAPMTSPEQDEQSRINKYISKARLRSFQSDLPGLKSLGAMRSSREPERCLSLPEETGRGILYPDEALLQTRPELPKRINFKRYRLPELRQAAQDHGISDRGQRKELITRLEMEDKALFREEMKDYQEKMLKYSAEVHKLLSTTTPEIPHRKSFETYTLVQLQDEAHTRKMEDGGSANELLARLEAWEKALYEERVKVRDDHRSMKARIARIEWF